MPSTSYRRLAGLVAVVSLLSGSFVQAQENSQVTQAPPTPTILRRDGVADGSPATPILSTLSFAYSSLPTQVYPFTALRGPQTGFNNCNDSTLGPNSMCQTLVFNGPDDFCLWGSPKPNGLIGDIEADVVAYCTKPYHGTRVIPPGAITGLQWMKTSGYIQVSGFIDNTGLGLDPTDDGGELDPHGADLQGNPLGGIVFSNGTTDSDGHTPIQAFNWNMFVGSGQFCAKVCYNSQKTPDYCQNTYDLLGCDYNMPSAVQNGTFTSCEGDVQDVVGVYTTNGVVTTWAMPSPLTQPPYTPRIPASTNCKTFQSSDLFLASTPPAAATPTPTGTGTGGSTPTGTPSGTGTNKAPGTGTTPAPTQTKKTGAAFNIRAPAGIFFAAAAVGAFAL